MVNPWLLAVTATGMILAGPAFGHAKLRSAIPAADAQLPVAPKSLTLSFNEDVRLAVLTLTANGKDIPVTVDRSAPAAPQVTVTLPVLAVGIYQVRWSALSPDDGHVSKGTFSFAVLGPVTAPATPR
jgi:methionine-rich copper-binding protein CopC